MNAAAEDPEDDPGSKDLIHRLAKLVTASFTLAEAEGNLLRQAILGLVTKAGFAILGLIALLVTAVIVEVGIFIAVRDATNLVTAVFVLAGTTAVLTGLFFMLSKVIGGGSK